MMSSGVSSFLRPRVAADLADAAEAVVLARGQIAAGNDVAAFGIVREAVRRFPASATSILAAAYDLYAALSDQSRYGLYQKHLFEFPLRPGDRILDIGSGHLPFPLATELADITTTNHHYGRGGAAFRYIEGKPVHEVSVEATGFADKAFDFVYCSHVLEHTEEPERACRELMRIGRRGYIETPSPSKDAYFAMARLSNHRWGVELVQGVLVFTEYDSEDLDGIGDDVLLEMVCDPRSDREKALCALMNLNADKLNTILFWEEEFTFRVERKGSAPAPAG